MAADQAGAIRTVCVAGGGAMGLGIVRSFVAAGFETWLMSRDPAAPKPGLPEGVRRIGLDAAATAPPDLLIESIPEEMALKQAFLDQVEAAWGDAAILASNTSVLPLQELADARRHPARFCGLHYMYPADALPFAELIAVRQSDPAMLDAHRGDVWRAPASRRCGCAGRSPARWSTGCSRRCSTRRTGWWGRARSISPRST